jgi:hypothetical protein
MSKSPVYIGAGSQELAVTSALNIIDNANDISLQLQTVVEWVSLTDGTTVFDFVDNSQTTEYSAKEYAQGIAATGGTAKQWALGGGSHVEATAVTGSSYSARKYATNAAASASLAEGYTDAFDDKYLGSHTTASREVGANVGKDNDGDALDDGALYYDTTLEVMKVWDDTGSAWKQLTPTTANQTQINTLTTGYDGTTTTSGTNLNLVQVDTVADNIANVNKVGVIDGNVTKVADIDGNVTKVADIDSNVTKVADIDSNVTKVADVDGEVVLVAAVDGEVALVSAVDTEVGRLGVAIHTTATTGNLARLGTAPMATASTGHLAYLGTAAMANTTDGYLKVLGNATVTADLAILGSTTVTDDMALLAISDVIDDMETCSNNIAEINSFADLYQIDDFSPSAPTLDGGGNAVAEGDLAYDSTANRLKFYDGSAFVAMSSTTETTTAADNSAVAMSIALG